MADTDRHIASVAVNALRLLRRKTLPPVSTTELCDMLVGSLFLPPQYAWFKSVEVYATLKSHGKGTVLGVVNRLVERGVFELRADSTLHLVAANLHLLDGGGGAGGGGGGTGKSFLLRHIISGLRAKFAALGKSDAVVVTAPTGIAACNIGGVTIHSFAGIGQAKEPADKLLSLVLRHERNKSRWKACAVLVVDEVSMLDGALFDKLDFIARKVRGRESVPFGGIQLVLAGDFFQLPPVGISNVLPSAAQQAAAASATMRAGGAYAPPTPIKFCFEANMWGKSLELQFTLERVFRQRDDTFVRLLNEFRVGHVSQDALRILSKAGSDVRELAARGAATKPTSIYATNSMVDQVNAQELKKCTGEMRLFLATDGGEENFLNTLRNSCPAPASLELRVGAQVMLLKNLETEVGLVNGARGVVTRFVDGFPEVRFLRPGGVSAAPQPPRPPPEGGGPDGDDDAVPPPACDELVRVLQKETWSLELGSHEMAFRSQLPLKLAYALSIHKSQGMTINLLDVSMKGIFEFGQAYVALSRAVSLDAVVVRDFSPTCVRAHPLVSEYYKWLQLASSGKAKGPFVSSTAAAAAVAQLPRAGGTAPQPGVWAQRGIIALAPRPSGGAGGGAGGGGGLSTIAAGLAASRGAGAGAGAAAAIPPQRF